MFKVIPPCLVKHLQRGDHVKFPTNHKDWLADQSPAGLRPRTRARKEELSPCLKQYNGFKNSEDCIYTA